MHITCTWFNDQFNVDLSSQPGREAFLSIKGCRIVDGPKGEFVSWPARKMDNGNWWRHVWGSEGFMVEVIKAAKASMPAKDTRTHGERKARQDPDAPPF